MFKVVEGVYEDGKISLNEKTDTKTSFPHIKSRFDIEELYHEAKMHA